MSRHAWPYAAYLDNDREYDGRVPRHRAEVVVGEVIAAESVVVGEVDLQSTEVPYYDVALDFDFGCW